MDTDTALPELDDYRTHLVRGKPVCARLIGRTLDLIANKWAVPVILTLSAAHCPKGNGRPARFSELARAIPMITQKELTKQLRALEAAGLVRRQVYAEVPPRVEYALTRQGRSLKPVLDALARWAAENGPKLETSDAAE